jgi:hypothetical protein
VLPILPSFESASAGPGEVGLLQLASSNATRQRIPTVSAFRATLDSIWINPDDHCDQNANTLTGLCAAQPF